MRVNLDACIQCGLCVRACREVQVNDVIGMPIAVTAKIVFDFDESYGRVDLRGLWRMCPGLSDGRADALGDARRRIRPALIYADRKVDSLCPFCASAVKSL